MNKYKELFINILILSIFILPATSALAESAQQQGTQQQNETYEKQKVEKLDSGRYNQLKSDTDPKGRTPENKGNFDPNVPQGEGIEHPPARKAQPDTSNPAPSGTGN
ncbi:hypothetical protein [Nitrosomonas sp. Nm166]|uniref:hypothetical protein n=1 Tax=Nitrosomonas sp. Nm166 TaxID=1881054 RepID=UPI0008E3C08C|nr:hypothetical protein [Nitrosomonas sp. Nm166]SFF06517.1 hypothetical protein SAMN05428977_104623 [Nitrosomonas sp. Nm166]